MTDEHSTLVIVEDTLRTVTLTPLGPPGGVIIFIYTQTHYGLLHRNWKCSS